MLAKSLRYSMQLSGLKLKATQMIQANKKDHELMEKIKRGLKPLASKSYRIAIKFTGPIIYININKAA